MGINWFIYLLFGPGLWLLFAYGLINARMRLIKLRRNTKPLPDSPPPPEVTILVPAHNEGAGIRNCLKSILAIDYPCFRVIAIDDRSTDATLSEMRAVASVDPRLEVLAIDSKPPDWLGKCHALHLGAQKAQSPWLLFIDSDVTVTPGCLRQVMAQALARNIDALSILTRQECLSFWERLLTPVACAAILGMYLASSTNEDRRRKTAFANGQFFLIKRETYHRAGGHEVVRNLPTEDVDLMRALKRTGSRCRLYAGEHLAATRMYDSLGRMFKGWARIYSGASHRRPWRIFIGIGFVFSLLGALFMPLVSAYRGNPYWLAASVSHLLLVLGSLWTIYRWSGNKGWYSLLFPLTAVFQLGFYVYALYWCYTNKMEWRGTAYSTAPDFTPSSSS